MQDPSSNDLRQQLSEAVKFSSQTYGLDEIKRASYCFLDLMSVDISPGEDEIICVLNFLSPKTAEEAQIILNDFKIEVLDQDLRKSISEETKEMRNAVLAYAFSKTGLLDE